MWMIHEDFQTLVDNSWTLPIKVKAKFTLKQKLSRLKPKLRALNNLHFNHILQRAARTKEQLDEMQKQILLGAPRPPDYQSMQTHA